MIFRDPVSPREGRGLAPWRSPDVVAFSVSPAGPGQEQVARKGPKRHSPVCSFPEMETTQSASAVHRVTGPSTVQPAAIPPFPPLPPGTYVQRHPCSRSGARCCAARCRLTLPVSAKKTKPLQAAGYPDGAAPPPALGRACGDRDRGRGVRGGGERAEVGPEGATPITPTYLRMLWASAAAIAALSAVAGVFCCAEFCSGRQK